MKKYLFIIPILLLPLSVGAFNVGSNSITPTGNTTIGCSAQGIIDNHDVITTSNPYFTNINGLFDCSNFINFNYLTLRDFIFGEGNIIVNYNDDIPVGTYTFAEVLSTTQTITVALTNPYASMTGDMFSTLTGSLTTNLLRVLGIVGALLAIKYIVRYVRQQLT